MIVFVHEIWNISIKFWSETFSMDNWGTIFFIVFFGNPHGGESWEMGENSSSNPDGVFSFTWSGHFNFHLGWGEVDHLLLESLWDIFVHGSTTRHDQVFVEIFSDIDITSHDSLKCKCMHSIHFFSDMTKWIKESFWGSELLISDCDDVSVW